MVIVVIREQAALAVTQDIVVILAIAVDRASVGIPVIVEPVVFQGIAVILDTAAIRVLLVQ